MPYTSTSIAFRGAVARAQAEAYKRRDPEHAVTGTFPCPRCGSPISFTTLIDGRSRGQCLSGGGCVRWAQ